MSFADSVKKHNENLVEKKYQALTETEINILVRERMALSFKNVGDSLTEIARVVAKQNPFRNIPKTVAKAGQDSKTGFTHGTNGLVQYESHAGAAGAESIHERIARGRYWKSMGKKIRKGSSIK